MSDHSHCDKIAYDAAKKANSAHGVRIVIYRHLHPLLVSQIYRKEVDGFCMMGHPASPAFAGSILIGAGANSSQLRDFRMVGGVVLDTENDIHLSPAKFLVREAYLGKASREHLLRLNEGRRLGLDLNSALDQTLGSDEQSREKITACLSVPLLEQLTAFPKGAQTYSTAHHSLALPLNPARWINQPIIA